MDSIEREMSLFPPDRPVETVFFGGGTPGLLAAKDLDRLCGAVRTAAGDRIAEWTIEMAPSTVKPDKLSVLREHGVTRISMGVQSFSEKWLEALGRQHNLTQVNRALEQVRAAAFPNLNLDLIFAMPGQRIEDWQADLDEAMRREPQHISTYCLTFEEDTKLWVKLTRQEVRKLDESAEAQFYLEAQDRLAAGGFAQYEISNFARPGFACRHNLATWRMQEWIGYGPSAASQFGGRRWQNVADLTRWAEALDRGERAETEVVALTDEILATDALIFGLRRNEGVEAEGVLAVFDDATRARLEELFSRLEAEGMLVREAGRLVLTREGRLVADAIGAELLAAGAVEA